MILSTEIITAGGIEDTTIVPVVGVGGSGGGTGTGGGSAPFESKDSKWSSEQLAYFKQRGLNPDKVWENYAKYKN